MVEQKKIPLTFITGNKKKLEEFTKIMEGCLDQYEVTNKSLDLDELQGTPEFIAENKINLAATKAPGTIVMCEDVSLCFNAFNGLPGPYIKDFMTSVGCKGLWDMISQFEDKTAYAQCIFAMCEGPGKPHKLFVGKCHGKIV